MSAHDRREAGLVPATPQRSGVVEANGVEICYETIGNPRDPALLLVMGLGVQLNGWDVEFCQKFVDRGFYLVRYDNRDTGLSTKFDAHVPDVVAALKGDLSSAAYTLADMAEDGLALLDALEIRKAHLVGTSMGGMIAQTMAIRHPDRVLSLCSIMSTTGARDVGRAEPEARAAILEPAPDTRDGMIEAAVKRGRTLSGGGFPFDEERLRRRAAAAYDRAHHPAGRERQQVAVVAAEDRTESLKRLTVPTLILHGASDPLVTLSGGEATAAVIPDARLVVIPGMGHEIPVGAWAQIVDEIVANTKRATLEG